MTHEIIKEAPRLLQALVSRHRASLLLLCEMLIWVHARADRLLLAASVAAAHSWSTGVLSMRRTAAGAVGKVIPYVCLHVDYYASMHFQELKRDAWVCSQRSWP